MSLPCRLLSMLHRIELKSLLIQLPSPELLLQVQLHQAQLQ
jgi:hypothetical protein